MADDDVTAISGPLSWRDVYQAVGESERRVVNAIENAVSPLSATLRDHEARLVAEEAFTTGLKASSTTVEKILSFGKWALATMIALSALVITALSMMAR